MVTTRHGWAAVPLAYAVASSMPMSAGAARAPRVWAHYLPWYDTTLAPPGIYAPRREGWCDEPTQNCSNPRDVKYSGAPLIGEYSQFKDEVLEYHLLSALAAGLDGFIINWAPSSAFQTTIVDRVFAAAEALSALATEDGGGAANVSLIVSYDPGTGTTTEAEAVAHFSTLRARWANSSVYFRDDGDGADDVSDGAATKGQPVVLLWASASTGNYSRAARSVFSGGGGLGSGVLLLVRNAVEATAFSEGNFMWVAPTPYYVADPAVDWGEVRGQRTRTPRK